MAKNKNIVVCVLLLLVGFCVNGQSVVNPSATLRGTELRKRVIDTALSQVGVREVTGKNDGREVEKYLRTVGLGKGYAWCAAFVSWDYKVTGTTTFKTAWAPAWFPENKVLFKGSVIKRNRTPQPGDLGGLWINKRIGHVFIIYAWSEKTVKTIEGNTNEAGSREGDGVYIKRRLRKQIYTVSNWID